MSERGGGVPGAPSHIPGLPENATFYELSEFRGLNRQVSRLSIHNQEFSWCQNLVPVNAMFLRSIPDLAPLIYTAPTPHITVPPTLLTTDVSPDGDSSPPLGPFSITANVFGGVTTVVPNTVLVATVVMLQTAEVAQPPGLFPPIVNTMTSSPAGLSWTRRSRIIQNPTQAGIFPPAAGAIETWWAPSTSVLTAETVTATFTGGCAAALMSVQAFAGAPLVNPWDVHAGLPFSAQNTTVSDTVVSVPSVSTTATGTAVLSTYAAFGPAPADPGIPSPGIVSVYRGAVQPFVGIATAIKVSNFSETSPLVAQTIPGGTVGINYWIGVVDALAGI